VAEAVDRYLRGYVDVYGRLGAHWIVVHAGYHFTSDKKLRMDAGLERLKRLVDC
jgi:endonuclease IV